MKKMDTWICVGAAAFLAWFAGFEMGERHRSAQGNQCVAALERQFDLRSADLKLVARDGARVLREASATGDKIVVASMGSALSRQDFWEVTKLVSDWDCSRR